jgi:hypothetical protein
MIKNLCAEEAVKHVESKKQGPFVGAKVFEHMDFCTSHVQGDVEVICVESIPPMSELEKLKDFNGIIAEGFSNSGHHCVMPESMKKIKAYRWKNGGEFQGPFVVASGMWTLTHPVHKWASFPAGCFEVKFPREMNLGMIRRQRD